MKRNSIKTDLDNTGDQSPEANNFSRRDIVKLLFGGAGFLALGGLTSCVDSPQESKKESDKTVKKSKQPEVLNESWEDMFLDICRNNNFPGMLNSSGKESMTIGLTHRAIGEKGALNEESQEEDFRKLIPLFEEISKTHKLIFVPEGLYTEGHLGKQSAAFKYDCLIPESLRSLKTNWIIAGADQRSRKYGADLVEIMEMSDKIFEKVTISLNVGKGEMFDFMEELRGPLNVEVQKDITQEEYDILFTFNKLFMQINNEFEKDMRSLEKDLIEKGYFPVFLVGAMHTQFSQNTYCFANPENHHRTIMTLKALQYQRAVLDQNEDYVPSDIPENFKKFEKYLD